MLETTLLILFCFTLWLTVRIIRDCWIMFLRWDTGLGKQNQPHLTSTFKCSMCFTLSKPFEQLVLTLFCKWKDREWQSVPGTMVTRQKSDSNWSRTSWFAALGTILRWVNPPLDTHNLSQVLQCIIQSFKKDMLLPPPKTAGTATEIHFKHSSLIPNLPTLAMRFGFSRRYFWDG